MSGLLPLGGTWLLAVDGDNGSMWALPPRSGALGPVPFQNLARDTVWDANQVARWYSVVARDDPEDVLSEGAWFVRWDGPATARGPSRGLDGPSFGLALTLAAVSRRLELHLPADLACTGVICRDGAVGMVQGLREKISALMAFAQAPVPFPGGGPPATPVTRMLVPAENAAEANRHRDALGFFDLRIVGVQTVAEALVEAFGERALAGAEDRACAADASGVAGKLFELALAGAPNFLPWSAVARVAERAAGMLAPGLRPWREASIAAAIARRHAAAPVGLPPDAWDWIAELPHPVALRLTAHIVQGCADSAEPGWREVAARAEGLYQGVPFSEGVARVQGALGRLHAAWLQYDEALILLKRAVDGWVRLYALPEASMPLCEWLRVAALARPGELTQVIERAETCLRGPMLAPTSAEYLRLALIRADAAGGDVDRANARFARLPADSSLRRTALRHLAIAGDLNALEELRMVPDEEQTWLADLALGDRERAIANLATTHSKTDLDRLLGMLGADANGMLLAHHWRY